MSRRRRESRGVREIDRLERRGIDDLELRAELKVFPEEGGEGRVVQEKVVAGRGRRGGGLRGKGDWGRK